MTVEHDHEVGIGRSGRRPVERRIPRHGAEPDSQAQEVCVPRPALPHTRRRRGRPTHHLGRVRQRRQQPGALPRRGAAEIAVELSELVPVAGRLLALRAGMAAPLRDLVHAHHQRAHDGDQQERRVRPVEGVEGGAGGERGEQHHDVERRFAALPVRRVRRAQPSGVVGVEPARRAVEEHGGSGADLPRRVVADRAVDRRRRFEHEVHGAKPHDGARVHHCIDGGDDRSIADPRAVRGSEVAHRHAPVGRHVEAGVFGRHRRARQRDLHPAPTGDEPTGYRRHREAGIEPADHREAARQRVHPER